MCRAGHLMQFWSDELLRTRDMTNYRCRLVSTMLIVFGLCSQSCQLPHSHSGDNSLTWTWPINTSVEADPRHQGNKNTLDFKPEAWPDLYGRAQGPHRTGHRASWAQLRPPGSSGWWPQTFSPALGCPEPWRLWFGPPGSPWPRSLPGSCRRKAPEPSLPAQ